MHIHMCICMYVGHMKDSVSVRDAISERGQFSQLSKKRKGFLEDIALER